MVIRWMQEISGGVYMIKTLQKKFIATAMAAISILLLVLTGTINVANGLISARQTDEQLKMLAETEKLLMKQLSLIHI